MSYVPREAVASDVEKYADQTGVLRISTLSDNDADTFIKLETTTDDDFIRVSTAGTERLVLDNTGTLTIKTATVSATDATTVNLATSASNTTVNIGTGAGSNTITLGGSASVIVLGSSPTASSHAANRGYVDSQISGLSSTYLGLAGGTLTGALTLHADPSSNLHAATKQYVDSYVGTNKVVVTSGSSSTVATNTDILIINKGTGGAHTVALPAGASFTRKTLIIKDGKGDAGTNPITIDANESETIDGSATKIIDANYMALTLTWNGTEWNIV